MRLLNHGARSLAFILGLGFAIGSALSAADAATITKTLNFSSTQFTAQGGGKAPVDPVTGSVTFTLDDTQRYSNQATGIKLNTINIKVAGSVLFDYDPSQRYLVIGGNGLANSYTWGSNDFSLGIFLDATPSAGFFGYSQAGIHDSFYTYHTTLTPGTALAGAQLAATPIPGSLLMLGTALAALGGFGWMRRRATA